MDNKAFIDSLNVGDLVAVRVYHRSHRCDSEGVVTKNVQKNGGKKHARSYPSPKARERVQSCRDSDRTFGTTAIDREITVDCDLPIG